MWRLEMNKQNKIIFGLRIVLLGMLILFLMVFITSVKTDCQECSFDVEDETISAQEFFQKYYERCLVKRSPFLSTPNFSDFLRD